MDKTNPQVIVIKPMARPVQAAISKEDYAQLVALAKEKDWSVKKLAENIIRDYLKSHKKKK